MRNVITIIAGLVIGLALGMSFVTAADRAASSIISPADRAAVQAIIETAKE